MTAESHQAAIAKSILEENGIKAVILNQHDSSYATFGEYRVYIEEHDEAKAIDLLKELRN